MDTSHDNKSFTYLIALKTVNTSPMFHTKKLYQLKCVYLTEVCNPNPCQNNGVCRAHLESYVCDCPPGYYGDQCQTGKNKIYSTIH